MKRAIFGALAVIALAFPFFLACGYGWSTHTEALLPYFGFQAVTMLMVSTVVWFGIRFGSVNSPSIIVLSISPFIFCTGISLTGFLHGTFMPLLFWLPQLVIAYGIAAATARFARRQLKTT
jgi:hypothetical protein